MNVNEMISALNENEEFLKKFVECENAGQLKEVLSCNGFQVSEDEIQQMFDAGVKGILANDDDEFTEEQLDNVAGGGFLSGTLRGIASGAAAFGYGALCGICPAAYAYAPHVATGLAVWTAAGYMKK